MRTIKRCSEVECPSSQESSRYCRICQNKICSIRLIMCCRCCSGETGIHEVCLEQEIRARIEKDPLELKHSEFEGLMEIKCQRCDESIFFRRDFSYRFECGKYEIHEKCFMVSISIQALSHLGSLIFMIYLLAASTDQSKTGYYVFGLVLFFILFVLYFPIVPCMLWNQFYRLDSEAIHEIQPIDPMILNPQ